MDVHAWMLYWRGQRQFSLNHDDGSPIIDLNLGELKHILKRSDQHTRFEDVLREMRARREARHFYRDKYRYSDMATLHKEGRQAIRAVAAPRGFADIRNNPVPSIPKGVSTHA
jgi:hypothetical protein